MVRIDLFLLGYRRAVFPEENAKAVANILLRHGIGAKIENNRMVYLKASDCKRLQMQLSALGVKLGELCGLPQLLGTIVRKKGVIFALIPLFIILLFSSDLVWDVRIESDETVASEAVIDELRALGLHIGARWSKIDCGKTEGELLLSSDSVSWVSINRRGGVAYVRVAPKISREDTEGEGFYSNVVAKYDCIIEEITVISGYAAVSVGDAVSCGDLLISGVIPESAGGGFCHAEGIVRGRVTREYSSEVKRNEPVREGGSPQLSELSVQIFDFSINIFKKYGNIQQGCDIIKDIEDFIVFGDCKLPLSLVKKYSVEYTERAADYSDDELVKIATSRLMSVVRSEVYSSDVVAIRTEGGFTDNGYMAKARLTVIADVGSDLAFDAE